MNYIEIITGFVMSRARLMDIFINEYDGGDDTNLITFDEFLQGMYYEKDITGDYFPCYFEEI